MWTGDRTPHWRIEHLNHRDETIGEIENVKGGKLSIVALSRLGGSASLDIENPDIPGIDFFTDRAKFIYSAGNGLPEIPLGVFKFQSPARQGANPAKFSFQLASKLSILENISSSDYHVVLAGTNIVNEIIGIIQSVGETRIVATPSDATLINDLVFEPDYTYLGIINKLCESAGYRALWVDGTGQLRLEPLIDPSRKALDFEFRAGELSIHKRDWIREENLTGVPNRVTVWAPGSDDTPAIVGVAENNDPDSPFSIPSRNGEILSRQEEVSDISSQVEAEALAQRLLIGGMNPLQHFKVTHAIVPLEPLSRVRFAPKGLDPVDVSVTRMDFDIKYDAQCRAEWRSFNV